MNYINNDKKPILLTDLDGVSIDWLKGFVNYMEHELGHKAEHLKPKHFSMIDIFPEIEKPYLHIKDYQHTDHYREVESYKGSYEAYKTLKEMGVSVIAVTSCGEEKKIQENRLYNLEKNFPDIFDDIHLLDLGADKTQVLSKYDNSRFIDDQLGNVLSGVKTGHKSYLWDMSYNKEDELPENAFRAENWNIIVDDYKKELGLITDLSEKPKNMSRRRRGMR